MRGLIDSLKINWASLEASDKRKAIWFAIILGILLFSILYSIIGKYVFSAPSTQKTVDVPKKETVRKLSGTPDAEWLREASAANAAEDRERLRKQVEQHSNSLDEYKKQNSTQIEDITESIYALSATVDRLALDVAKESAERRATMRFLAERVSSGHESEEVQTYGQESFYPGNRVVRVSPFDMERLSQMTGIDPASVATRIVKSDAPGEVASDSSAGKPAITTAPADTVKSKEKWNGGEGYAAIIPSGAVIRARLVSGMDAMVANNAGDANQPVIAKITEPILLPNGRKVDMRGCVLMAGGYGNLSTERVYMNTTILSCIHGDDEIFETTVSANALGQDGKLGVRGVLVTRDGALVLRTMQAGLLQGVATAFSSANSVNQPVLSQDGRFEFPSTAYVARSSLTEGVNQSLNQMVRRYNNILDQIFPVLQVDAGREIEFQVLQAFKVTKS